MKIVEIIVPDIHEQIEKLQKNILAKYTTDETSVIFLGDWFDSYAGITWETRETAKFLQDNIKNPMYTFLWGNHDFHYAFPFDCNICSGWNKNKLEIVKDHISDTLEGGWKKFKLFHWIENVDSKDWMLSHAGINPELLHPIKGFEKDWLLDAEEKSLHAMRYMQKSSSFTVAGRGRGGDADVGGVFWQDWTNEFVPVEGLNQIVGHSTHKTDVRLKIDKNSYNICLDTNLNHVILIYENGSSEIVKV